MNGTIATRVGRPEAQEQQHKDQPLALRVARSLCVRDICSVDAESGVELVHVIDAALRDTCSAVRAPALDALFHLCEEDVLDWKSAYAYARTIC